MFLFSRFLWTSFLASKAVAAVPPPIFDVGNFQADDIIQRDVAVIGGGAAGTYSAISLKDKGKSVIVVEKKDRLGGNVQTYIDPGTGTPIDYGVTRFHDLSIVQDFFKRFNMSLVRVLLDIPSKYYDFRTGEAVHRTFTPSPDEVSSALITYVTQHSKYPGLRNGTFLPSPVPEELYMPFEQFIHKYGIQAAVPTIYSPMVSRLLTTPVAEVFRSLTPEQIQLFQTGLFSPEDYSVSELYTRAAAELSTTSSLLLSSEVLHTHRGWDESGVQLIVRTPTGPKLLLAQKLLITIPPKLDFIAPFDLSAHERYLFARYINATVHTGLVKHSGLPSNVLTTNAALHHTKYDLPYLPATYSFWPTALPDLQWVQYATPPESGPSSDTAVQAEIMQTIKRLQRRNPDQFPLTAPEFVAFVAHVTYDLQVRAEDIKDGFYEKLYALQGQRNTYWTGAAWKGEDSSLIWRYSEDMVVSQLIADCKRTADESRNQVALP